MSSASSASPFRFSSASSCLHSSIPELAPPAAAVAAAVLLLSLLEKNADGKVAETDDEIYTEAQRSLRAVEGRLAWGERVVTKLIATPPARPAA